MAKAAVCLRSVLMKVDISSIRINDRKRKLNDDKVAELAESILLLGLLEPILVTQNGDEYTLLAGLHRLEAAKLLGWKTIEAALYQGDDLECELVEIDENLMNNDLTVLEQGEHIQRRNEILEAMGKRREVGRYPSNDEIVSPLKTTEDIAKEVGLSKRSAQQRTQIARDIVPAVKELIRDTPIADSTTQLLELARMKEDQQLEIAKLVIDGDTTVEDAKKQIKQAERDKQIQEQIKEIEQNDFTPPTQKYDVVVIDPPWPYGTEYDPNGRRAASPYPEMSLDEIKAIELPASDDCVLWFWTTHKFMRYSFDILDTWGFRDVAIVTWMKDRMGLGTYLRSQSEFCIMAIKGRPTINLTNQTTIINGKLKEHSRKPDEFYEMVNSLCVGYKLDYFSREKRSGWDQYGNDTNRF